MRPVLPSPRRGRATLGLAAVALVALSACARTEPQPEPAPDTTAASPLPSLGTALFPVQVPSPDPRTRLITRPRATCPPYPCTTDSSFYTTAYNITPDDSR